jgi:hypothetical protein
MENESYALAQSAAVALEACAEVLLNEPSDQVLDDFARVAEALGAPVQTPVTDDDLRQRFYDRFIVPSARYYVPVTENCIFGYLRDGEYGKVQGPQSDAVFRCYQAVGFDWKLLQGSDCITGSLRPDSLAAECAFLAYLKRCELEGDEDRRAAAARLSAQFAKEHLGRWIGKAHELMLRPGADIYTDAVALAADAVAACCS